MKSEARWVTTGTHSCLEFKPGPPVGTSEGRSCCDSRGVDSNDWIIVERPELRIISDSLWQQAQARREKANKHFVRRSASSAEERIVVVDRRIPRLFTKLADHEIDKLLGALMSDDVQRLIRRTIRFNWQGELIRAILRHPGVTSILLHTLLR